MALDYCTFAEVKAAMPDGNWGTSYDTILAALITRASREIDRLTKREPGAYYVTSDTTRYFAGSGHLEQWIGEIAAAPTTVAVAETGAVDNATDTGGTYTTWATSDYLLWPYNALAEGKPYRRLDIDNLNGSKTFWYRYPKAVKVTAKFGFSATPPADVVQATIIQTARWFKRGQQAFEDVGAIVELGQLRYVKQLDPDVALIVSYLTRMTI